MTEEYYKVIGKECFKDLEATNPKGGIEDFIRMAVQFGYERAIEDLYSKRTFVSHKTIERMKLIFWITPYVGVLYLLLSLVDTEKYWINPKYISWVFIGFIIQTISIFVIIPLTHYLW